MSRVVSIVIPCYDAAPWLAEAIESALAQTWPHRQIIVVDDGSRDDSLAIARGYESRGVRVITQANAGAAAARNRGVAEATGDYVQFLDADDLLDADKIAAQMTRLANEPADVVASGRWARFVTGTAASLFPPQPNFRDLSGLELLQIQLETGCMMHPAAWLTPTTVIRRAGPWDERLSLNDDGEYFARVALAAKRIAFCESSKVHYRSAVPGSLSRRIDRVACESLVLSCERIAGAILAVDDSARTRRAIANAWMRVAFDLYPAAPDLSRKAEQSAARFGRPTQRLVARPRARLASRVIGWRLAKRLLG